MMSSSLASPTKMMLMKKMKLSSSPAAAAARSFLRMNPHSPPSPLGLSCLRSPPAIVKLMAAKSSSTSSPDQPTGEKTGDGSENQEQKQLPQQSKLENVMIGLLKVMGGLLITLSLEIYTSTVARDVQDAFPQLTIKLLLTSFGKPGVWKQLLFTFFVLMIVGMVLEFLSENKPKPDFF